MRRFRRSVAVGVDAEKFDQHVSVDALKTEHEIYKRLYNDAPELCWLLKQQLANRCRGNFVDGSLSYEVKGSRMSGDINTSLGNVTIMCLMLYSYLEHAGVECVEVANDGDDAVLIVDERELGKLADRKSVV